jgi:hypothetical protein
VVLGIDGPVAAGAREQKAELAANTTIPKRVSSCLDRVADWTMGKMGSAVESGV